MREIWTYGTAGWFLCLALLLPGRSPAAPHPDATKASIDANPYHLEISGHAVLSPSSPTTLRHLELHAVTVFHYVDNPLVVRDRSTGRVLRALVRHREQLNIGAAIGLFGWGELGLLIPVIINQDSQFPGHGMGQTARAGLGNFILYGKAQVLAEASALVDLAILLPLHLPTGDNGAYMGYAEVGFAPQILLRRGIGPVAIALALGYHLQPRTEIFRLVDDDEWIATVAATYGQGRHDWQVSVELVTATRAQAPFAAVNKVRSELVAGGRYALGNRLSARLAVGLGLFVDIPTPAFRVAGGIAVHLDALVDEDFDGIGLADDTCPAAPEDHDGFEDDDGCPDPDNDEDGISDSSDRCPLAVEDVDNYEDQDGCPDSDNDQDGIPDGEDHCPNDAEDIDHLQDEDGCPETDVDGDGVGDLDDKCPQEPEDVDGFADEDGCPEIDNDEDGFLDADDKCRDEAEDVDDFADDDGCPDPDNDGDGLLDAEDQCPNEAEIINNVADEDGCPDQGESLVELTVVNIELRDRVHFVVDRAVIRWKSYPILRQVVALLKNHAYIKKVHIAGFTDDTGPTAYNLKLSDERAHCVMQFLIGHGIAPERLEAKGYGESRPRLLNLSPRSRRYNRRVEFIIVEVDETAPPAYQGLLEP